jgi:hypothetical protein
MLWGPRLKEVRASSRFNPSSKRMSKKTKKKTVTISIPEALRSPLREGSDAHIASEAEHAFFLRCFELYRVIELADRTLDPMIEAYSKYRTRDLFKETFQTRRFESGGDVLDGVEPGMTVVVFAMFNLVHELRLSLLYEDALPFTVKARIEATMAELKREWNLLQSEVESRLQWKFKSL